MKLRRQTVEHVFGTLKGWMGSSHFLNRTLPRAANRDDLASSGLQPEAGDLPLGTGPLVAAMKELGAVP
jgi:hypothetical protein